MSELSIFIDESGDFGEVKERPAYYLVTMVFHNQAVDISKEIEKLEESMRTSGRLSKEIAKMIARHSTYFQQFDKVIVYYDNGQAELSAILNAVLSVLFSEVEFRKAEPQKYRLLQVADFVCSMELLKIKREEKRLSKSEEKFFYKPQELKKTFLKSLEEKRLK